jgi:hypothetical protein
MIPDYNALVRKGYEYLSVGGALLKQNMDRVTAENFQRQKEVSNGQKEPA